MYPRKIKTCKLCNKEVVSQHGRPRTWCDMKCKNMYNNSIRKSTKRTKQIECKTCGSLSLNKYCSRLCYPTVGSTWYKIKRFNQLKKELKDIGYKV
jgi:NAD-dependent SIR2 family protein deacetylase